MAKQDPQYISLKEAEQYCPYSADYLKLRARKGKLKALKFGRRWVTKEGWVKEYAKEMEGYWQERRKKEKPLRVIIAKPEGLEETTERPFSLPGLKPSQINIPSSLSRLAPAVLVALLVFTGVVFGKGSVLPFYRENIKPIIASVYHRAFESSRQLVDGLGKRAGRYASGTKDLSQ